MAIELMSQRVGKDDLLTAKHDLEQFHSVPGFERLTAWASAMLTSEQLFNDPNAKFVTEAFTACHVAAALGADRVRLVSDQWPDAEIAKDGETFGFEFTEADLPGRKRGKEYKDVAADRAPRLTHDSIEDWHRAARAIPVALAERGVDKAHKGYPENSVGLVIHLNISEWGIEHERVVAGFATATAEAAKAFTEVWILWDRKLWLIWKDGERSSVVLPAEVELGAP